MKTLEAFKALTEGKNIRRIGSNEAHYFYMKDGTVDDSLNHNISYMEQLLNKHSYTPIAEFLDFDWEIYEKPVETFDFLTALKYLKEYKKVNRMLFKTSHLFTYLIREDDGVIAYTKHSRHDYCVCFEDSDATDWYLID